MPSFVPNDALLRVYEYNFWLYHYIARKFKIEFEYGYEFDTQGGILQTQTQLDTIMSPEFFINVLHDVAASGSASPFDPDGREAIQRLIRAWHDYCVEEEKRTYVDAFYPMTMYPDDVQEIAEYPDKKKAILEYLYRISMFYGYYAYALPCAKKMTALSENDEHINLYDTLDSLADAEETYNQWLGAYLKQHREEYFFKHDFMPNYRNSGQPGHDQIKTNSKTSLDYILYKRNFKYGSLGDENIEYYFKEYITYLSLFQKITEVNIDKRYVYILFLIDNESLSIEKTLKSIDRIIDAMQVDPTTERVSIRYINVDGKPTDDRSKIVENANAKHLLVLINLSDPTFATNTAKKKIREIYLKSVCNFAPDEIAEKNKPHAMLMQSLYCPENFRAQLKIRMAALLIWDTLYFDKAFFQQKTKDELDKIASDLISGKIYINADNAITTKREEAFIDLEPYDSGGHLRVAFKQICLSIAQGAVLPTAIKHKK